MNASRTSTTNNCSRNDVIMLFTSTKRQDFKKLLTFSWRGLARSALRLLCLCFIWFVFLMNDFFALLGNLQIFFFQLFFSWRSLARSDLYSCGKEVLIFSYTVRLALLFLFFSQCCLFVFLAAPLLCSKEGVKRGLKIGK